MAVRVLVERTFSITGRGPVVVGLLQTGKVSTGDTLVVAETGAEIRVRGLEMHVPQPDDGQRVGLLVHPEDAPAVTPGSTLVSRPES
jgi:selenocysteine-specific elongation factor